MLAHASICWRGSVGIHMSAYLLVKYLDCYVPCHPDIPISQVSWLNSILRFMAHKMGGSQKVWRLPKLVWHCVTALVYPRWKRLRATRFSAFSRRAALRQNCQRISTTSSRRLWQSGISDNLNNVHLFVNALFVLCSWTLFVKRYTWAVFGFQDSGYRIQDPGSMILDPGFMVQDPEYSIFRRLT